MRVAENEDEKDFQVCLHPRVSELNLTLQTADIIRR